MARKAKRAALDPVIDATKERLAHAVNDSGTASDAWDYIDPSRIDSHKPIGLVRRFRSSHLDRFYRRDDSKSILTFRQWYAGDWYRNTHARSGFTMSVIASYGERTSCGEPNYGLPRTEAQAQARDLWRTARQQFRRQMVGFMDRLLLHDELPRYGGSHSRFKAMSEVRSELDALADWLKLGTEEAVAR